MYSTSRRNFITFLLLFLSFSIIMIVNNINIEIII